MRILQVASYNGNIGDCANHTGFRSEWKRQIGEDIFENLEMRYFYRSWNQRKFDESFIRMANEYDLLIFGGGGFFELNWDYSATGTTIDLSKEVLEKIEIPILFNCIGTNAAKGASESTVKKFDLFLEYVIKRGNFVSVRNDGSYQLINRLYKDKYKETVKSIQKGSRMNRKPYIIAEAGCNHKGDMDIAKQMIQVAAAYCKADAIKFQKRCPSELLSKEQYDAPHPNPANAYGDTYGKHREFLEFTAGEHRQLKAWCQEYGIDYSTSVWDLTSAKEIAAIHPRVIKIPSACNNHYEMLRLLCENYEGEIHLSLGMTMQSEEETIIQSFEKYKRNKDLIIYCCTSGYPVPYEDVCLLEMCRLKEQYRERVKSIGFSGHHLGTAVDVAAYTLGAEIIERHFTLDKTWKGTDHGASLEPDEFHCLVEDLNHVHDSLSYKPKEILPIEAIQRKKLKYRT